MAKKKTEGTQRVETGIPGLDGLIEGGIPRGTLNLLSGHADTGRPIFAMQFLQYGAKEKNEPGVYITLEKEPEEILENMKRFNWDLEDLIKKKKLSIIKPDLNRFDTLKQSIEDEVDRLNAKRLVISPFSLITAYFENVFDVRKALSDLRREMKKLDCTALAITDIKEGEKAYSSSGFGEFVANGVIALDLVAKKESSAFVRTLFVRKMERTKHSLKLIPMEIGKKGIELFPDAEVF